MGVDLSLERVVLAELSRWSRRDRRRAAREDMHRSPGELPAERRLLSADAPPTLSVLLLGHHAVRDDRAALAGGA